VFVSFCYLVLRRPLQLVSFRCRFLSLGGGAEVKSFLPGAILARHKSRLGREAIKTANAMKQLVTAGALD